MSLKRILGVMLASRMAGRGGMGGLGAAAMLGGRRGGLMGKAGIASLGYMAYSAYRDRQGSGATGSSGLPGRTQAGQSRQAGQSGLSGLIGGALDSLTGAGDRDRDGPDAALAASAEAAVSDDTALLLLRAMIAAAHSDGDFSAEERARILGALDEGEATPAERRMIEDEMAHPRPLQDILAQVRDPETAQQVYLASRTAVDGTTDANRAYLANLRQRLDLSQADADEIDALAG